MMARMEMDYKMHFQIVKFGLEMFEILHKCCRNPKFVKKNTKIRNSFRKLLSLIYLEFFKVVIP